MIEEKEKAFVAAVDELRAAMFKVRSLWDESHDEAVTASNYPFSEDFHIECLKVNDWYMRVREVFGHPQPLNFDIDSWNGLEEVTLLEVNANG